MGLDTYIQTEKGEKLAYFRKNWTLQQWWIDLARVKYKDLALKWNNEAYGYTFEEAPSYLREEYEMGNFNCVEIPIEISTWKKCMKELKEKKGDEYCESYNEINQKILEVLNSGEKVFILGWW